MLTDVFNYKVVPAVLKHDPKRLAQVQIMRHLSQFVYDEDGPNTLLIVYYTGHGTPELASGNLTLSG